jgi:hypothetical protein
LTKDKLKGVVVQIGVPKSAIANATVATTKALVDAIIEARLQSLPPYNNDCYDNKDHE